MGRSAEQVAAEAVDAAIADVGSFDLKIEGASEGMPAEQGDGGPASYVVRHRHEYIRTVRDVIEFRPADAGRPVRVLELGAFFGVCCIALAKLGYTVTAADAPEFMTQPEQVERYGRHGVAISGVRLEEYLLPFADEAFDVVIMCEVLEHLNFNPLPLLKEINRILSPGGLFYLALPNAASIYNRVKLLRGEMIGFDVQEFFEQLDPRSSEIVNGHWREYTQAEIRRLLEPLGFAIDRQYYFSLGETLPATSLRKRAARLFYQRLPQMKENQVTLAVRARRTDLKLRIPATVHKELREL